MAGGHTVSSGVDASSLVEGGNYLEFRQVKHLVETVTSSGALQVSCIVATRSTLEFLGDLLKYDFLLFLAQ
jgi:hypothetical protein